MTKQTGEKLPKGVAVVGMACRFPGAPNLEAFRELLISGKEGVRHFLEDELSPIAVSESKLSGYVAARSIIEDVTAFDHQFFGFNPVKASLLDPQQRVMLETVWHAFEDAGYVPGDQEKRTGVFCGSTLSSWLLNYIMPNSELLETHGMAEIMTLNDQDHLPTRIAYLLNLKGPALSLGTSCSTSLLAVEQAFRSLLSYQTDMAVAGGVSVQLPQERGYLHREGGIQSSDGHNRSFDAKADGTLFGNGCGAVILKRVEDAVADGDSIYAVIRAATSNNDGAEKVGYTAPSVKGQIRVILDALELSNIDIQDLAFIEAHGTATKLGEPIEIRALDRALRQYQDPPHSVAIGSVKSNFGHLESASGIAGFIKACLGLRFREFYPSLNFTRPNPELQLDSTPFHVSTEHRSWSGKRRRCAGVSSFGMGGTNVHVILQECPVFETESIKSANAELVLASAKSKEVLSDLGDRITRRLAQSNVADLPGYARTSMEGRTFFSKRRAWVVSPLEKGQHVNECDEITLSPGRNVGFLFPGQSAQYHGMATQLYARFPEFRKTFDVGADWIVRRAGWDLRTDFFDISASEKIHNTDRAQLALFVTELSLYVLIKSLGYKPQRLAGHSIGEITAACVAGIMSFETGLELVFQRGTFMQAAPRGGMLSVRADAGLVTSLLFGSLEISVYNAKDRLVVSGTEDDIQRLQDHSEAKNVSCKRLRTSHAFHHSSLKQAADDFEKAISNLTFLPPSIPIWSNVDGKRYDSKRPVTSSYWKRQILAPVQFETIINDWLTEDELLMMEVGPGAMLGSLVKLHPHCNEPESVFSLMPSPKQRNEELAHFLSQLGQLWVGGYGFESRAFYEGYSVPKRPFESYPFKRHIHDLPLVLHSSDSSNSHLLPPKNQEAESNSLKHSNTIFPQSTSMVEHKEYIQEQLCQHIAKLSGSDSNELDANTHFMELGLDSLTLVNLNQHIKKTFGINIPFRKLQDEYASIDALSAFLLEHTEAPQTALNLPLIDPSTQREFLEREDAARSKTEPSSVKEKIIFEQMEIMRRQLDLLQASSESTDNPKQEPLKRTFTEFSIGSLKDAVNRETREKPSGKNNFRFKEHEQDWTAFTQSYLAKTSRSREHTQSFRTVLSDTRVMNGYRQAWKELVYPMVISKAKGGRVWDLDQNEYVDVVSGFGGLLLGHNPEFLKTAIKNVLDADSPMLSVHNDLAGPTAKLVSELTGHERVTFCNTGSEAVMTAMRLARLETGKDIIVYFEPDYHGNFDEVLARAEYNDESIMAKPGVGGIPETSVEGVIVLPYNCQESLDWIERHSAKVAAVMVEPVPSRHPETQPQEFLKHLRQICSRKDMALIFDEVVTGFRIAAGGAQEYFDIKADICTYGKVVANGMPIGIVAGDARFLDGIDGGYWRYGDQSFPQHNQTFVGGTFRKHPYSLAAVNAVLNYIKQNGKQLYGELSHKSAYLTEKINSLIHKYSWPLRMDVCESMFYLRPLESCPSMELLTFHMLEQGIYFFGERPYYLMESHSKEDLNRFACALEHSMNRLLAGQAVGREKEERHTPSSTSMEEGVPVTGSQKEIFLNTVRGEEASVAFNMLIHLEHEGELDTKAFAHAFDQIINRHKALSTRFSEDGNLQFSDVIPVPVSIRRKEEFSPTFQWDAYVDSFQDQAFDLHHGPLYRAEIIEIAPEKWQTLLCFHHIICDGWSSDILLSELSAFYNEYVKSNTRPELHTPVDYPSFVRDSISSADDPSMADYWKSTIKNDIESLQWRTITQWPTKRSFEAHRSCHILSESTLDRLNALSKKARVSVNTILLGAYAIWLSRLSMNKKLVIGMPIAEQPMSGNDGLVGHFTNLIPIRIDLQEDESVEHFLHRVHQRVQDALEHSNISYKEILSLCNIPPEPYRSPLVQATYNLQRPEISPSFSGTNTQQHSAKRRFTQFELAFDIQLTQNICLVQCDFLTTFFSTAQMSDWLCFYEKIVDQMTLDETKEVQSIKLLSKSEERELIQAIHPHLSTELVSNETIISRFKQSVEQWPDKVAVRDSDQALTYKDLDQQSDQVARELLRLGVAPGQRVGICLERSAELLPALLSVLKTGACYVPIDPNYPEKRVDLIIKDSEISLVLTSSGLSKTVNFSNVQSVILAAVLKKSDRKKTPSLPEITPSNKAYMIYTSGSTGKPKGVQVTHQNVVRLFDTTANLFNFNQNDRWVLFHSYAFDFSVWEMWGALFYGGTLTVVTQRTAQSTEEFYRLLHEHRITILNQTPTAFKLLAEHEHRLSVAQRLPLELRCVVFGGEKLEFNSLQKWIQLHGLDQILLVNMYGITETTVHATYFELQEDVLKQNKSIIGSPLSDMNIFVLDENLQVLPQGFIGEFYVSGLGLSAGYWKREELNQERFFDLDLPGGSRRVYKTGDLGYVDEKNQLVYVSRNDSQVKIRGHRIELEEITHYIRSVEDVNDALVMPVQISSSLQLGAYVILKDDADATSCLEAIKKLLQKQLPAYMIPSFWKALQQFPQTANGKVDVDKLPSFSNEENADLNHDRPQGAIEEVIASVWCEVLDRERVGRHANYFELGGDSVNSIRIVQQLRKQGVEVKTRFLFDYPSVAELAEALDKNSAAPTFVSNGIKNEAKKPSQALIYGIQHWFFREISDPRWYHQIAELEFNDLPDRQTLENAFTNLAGKHPTLRTAYHEAASSDDEQIKEFRASLLSKPKLSFYDLKSGESLKELMESSLSKVELPEANLIHAFISEAEKRIYLAIHHLAVDALSWPILLDDLDKALSGTALRMTASEDVFGWARRFEDAARNRLPYQATSYWKDERWKQVNIPFLHIEKWSSKPDYVNVQHRIKSSNDALNNRSSAGLLGHLGASIEAVFGFHSFSIDIEHHGRESWFDLPAPESMVGWFTGMAPLLLSRPEAGWNDVDDLKRQLDALPDNGQFFEYVRNQDGVFAPEHSGILFNYLGQGRSTSNYELTHFTAKALENVDQTNPKIKHPHAVEINIRSISGEWILDVVVDRARVDQDQFQAFMDEFLRALGGAQGFPKNGGFGSKEPAEIDQQAYDFDEILAQMDGSDFDGEESETRMEDGEL